MKKICGKCYFRLKEESENGAKKNSESNGTEIVSSEERVAPVDITQKYAYC